MIVAETEIGMDVVAIVSTKKMEMNRGENIVAIHDGHTKTARGMVPLSEPFGKPIVTKSFPITLGPLLPIAKPCQTRWITRIMPITTFATSGTDATETSAVHFMRWLQISDFVEN